MKFRILGAAAAALLAATAPAIAADGHAGHAGHKMSAPEGTNEASVAAVINSIDADGGKVNVTHEPVPALGWPKMTMDLPVTRRVDLGTVKTGSNVMIKLKKGRDKQFRVIAIDPAKK